ncbi:hypothetical protein GCM10007063_07650 [Lentibacillus kapialis]|uniref:Uncharacterized protein n=1 Tax=Lentibacillus kapialis TaxID=340214 RepID=A0A917UVG5_9BACI|nr:hypothetical protein [Lentibacillus kapialis]GGJ87679.1 hypothetical protein GCM10007063_07650 [Lentibacillus kapialis]
MVANEIMLEKPTDYNLKIPDYDALWKNMIPRLITHTKYIVLKIRV